MGTPFNLRNILLQNGSFNFIIQNDILNTNGGVLTIAPSLDNIVFSSSSLI
jgi:hypothetical protein